MSYLVLHTVAMRRYSRRAEARFGRDYDVPPKDSLATMQNMIRHHHEVGALSSYMPDPPLPLP